MDNQNNFQPNQDPQQPGYQQPQYQQPVNPQPGYQQQGYQQPGYQQPQYQQQPGFQQPMNQFTSSSSIANISMILGIGTLFLALLAWIVSCASLAGANSLSLHAIKGAYSIGTVIGFLGLVCGIVAIVLSISSKKSGKSGAATAGLVLGIIGLVLCVITTLACACGCSSAEVTIDSINDIDWNDLLN